MYKFIPVLLLPLALVACQQKQSHQKAQPIDTLISVPKPSGTDSLTAVPLALHEKQVIRQGFVPEGYNIFIAAEGDLNGDTCKDMVVALANNDESMENPKKRPLLLLLGQPDQTYKVAARSDKALMNASEGGEHGEPLKEFVIKNGYFSIENYGGMMSHSWEYIVTFKYDPADGGHWLLHRDSFIVYEEEEKETSRETKTEKDFGKVPFEQFDVEKDMESH